MKIVCCALLAVTIVSAQPRMPMEKPKNLKVLSDTLTGEQVRQIMFSYTSGLGVHCDYCHVGDDSKHPPQMDFASDMMTTKRTAREMVKMVRTINTNIGSIFKNKDDRPIEVSCVTCHRGSPQPRKLEDVLMEEYNKGGVAQAKQQYLDLRKQYYGGFTYDFREETLLRIARSCEELNKFDDAAAFLNLNAEYFPDSPRTMMGLASVFMQTKQPAKAKELLEKVLKADPENRMAKRMMQNIQQ